MSLTRVAIVESEAQLAVMQCLLEAAGIPYFVHGRHLGSMLPALYVPFYNAVSIMVPSALVSDAQDVLRDLQAAPAAAPTRERSPARSLRIVFEWLLFGWCVPGTRRRNDDEQHPQVSGSNRTIA